MSRDEDAAPTMEPPDRRVRKTRKALRDALVELILEKGYNGVTVGDIVERADVGRTTFYAHFTDKDDLLLSGFAEMHATLVPEGSGGGLAMLAELGRQMVVHVDGERRLYRAIFGIGGAGPLRARIESDLAGHVERALAAEYPAATAAARAMGARMATTAFLGLVAWWLDGDQRIPADSIADSFEAFAMPGLGALLGAPARR
jgi:AcrR family transcriptional regulator